ncbi:transcription factor SCREAM2-like isoform X2 [Punica granatum]|uniref:Plant bHLH transcription factor ACT-like domain-containing protein n=2 Tax=Punica granatum TaxID=22663 RepID=A0A218XAB3_PUNGR|nr:transcription factor SCREAM2-like isoform X2 [Punica granatum]XP_031377589.1 transcription factor SCREAM2-like isoform X2 [Punica granatum]OWM81650.1 hypothetical protein CDL15_Pgr007688 [Punica granatum]PKI35923.1 hypothetical protein CRG98_043677 [Punica granatum]
MSSRDHKRAALYEKFQQLRAATHSTSVNTTSIIVDAATYIEELKEKVETLNQEIDSSGTTSSDQNLPMEVDVETLDTGGFRINVHSEKDCPGLLVSILEAFEEMGLDVLDATVSCTDSFHLEAVGGEDQDKDGIDAQMVKETVLQAIKNWSES